MENIKMFFENEWTIRILKSIAIIIVSIIIYKFITYFIGKGEGRGKSKLFTSNKGKTYLKLIKSIVRYVFTIITFLILLQINGIDVSSVLAGVGILGVIFGLAIQDWIKDVIRGSSILSDDYFSVGDVVKYNNIEGKVLIIGLKTTKIQDLATSNVISIANRRIEEIQVVSKLIYVRIPMPYEVSVKKAEKAIDDIMEIVKQSDKIEDCKYRGVTELADSSVQYLIEVECNPINKLQARRDTLKGILLGLDKNNIEVPFNQIDVHTK